MAHKFIDTVSQIALMQLQVTRDYIQIQLVYVDTELRRTYYQSSKFIVVYQLSPWLAG